MEELDVGKKDLKVNKKDVLVSGFGKDLFKPKFDEKHQYMGKRMVKHCIF